MGIPMARDSGGKGQIGPDVKASGPSSRPVSAEPDDVVEVVFEPILTNLDRVLFQLALIAIQERCQGR